MISATASPLEWRYIEGNKDIIGLLCHFGLSLLRYSIIEASATVSCGSVGKNTRQQAGFLNLTVSTWRKHEQKVIVLRYCRQLSELIPHLTASETENFSNHSDTTFTGNGKQSHSFVVLDCFLAWSI